MNGFLIFLAFLTVVAAVLLWADTNRKKSNLRARQFVGLNRELLALLHRIEIEARSQLAAGNPDFDYTLGMITESPYVPPLPAKKGPR